MGREVASAYRRRKYTYPPASASAAARPRPSPPHNSSMESLSDPPDNLTPARKHHKLLKDGSEVWSKEVEKIFVDGLRLYWQSPWATYSRGRSRWRNQYLVDHLKKSGVERTKKQVASHIQVLRNMWRGQPEFHLVAGGEELFQENGLLAHTNQKPLASPTTASASRPVRANSTTGSSPSSTPEYPLSEFASDGPSALSYPPLSPPSHNIPYTDIRPEDVYANTVSPTTLTDPNFGVLASSPPMPARPIAPNASVKLEPLAMDSTLFSLPSATYGDAATDYAISPPNRISSLYFWADGMAPLSVDVDRLLGASPSAPYRALLHLRVSMPPVADLRCPPNLQGINGAAAFAQPWQGVARCHTKSWGAGRAVVAQDYGVFVPVSTPELQTCFGLDAVPAQRVCAFVPDSTLTRCHWLDSVRTITQQIVVDNEVLAVLVFHIERTPDATRAPPAIELMGAQKQPWRGVPPASPPFSLLGAGAGSPPVSPTLAQFPHAAVHSPAHIHTHVPVHAHGHGHGHGHAPHSPMMVPRASMSMASPVVGGLPTDDLGAHARMMGYGYAMPNTFGFRG